MGVILIDCTSTKKPEQLPQVKKGEQLPLQSLSCCLEPDELSLFASSRQLSIAQQGMAEQIRT